MRAVNRIGWPTITASRFDPSWTVKSAARAKTTTRPEITSSRTRCRLARNISRPWPPAPTDNGLSVGVTVTGAVVPNAAVTGWRPTASARRATANPKPAPATPTATSPALTAPSRPRSWCAARSANTPAIRPAQHHAKTRPTGQQIPAAVTSQQVRAAGTNRTSSLADPGGAPGSDTDQRTQLLQP